MASRLKLHEEFLGILNYAYFNPPESKKMNYPCVRYYLSAIDVKHADDRAYKCKNRYTVLVITPDPDDDYHIRILEHFPMCSYERSYNSNNLVHHVLNLYY